MRLSASWSNESTSWTTDMENYSEDTEANKSKKQSRRSDVVKRMMSAYKEKKRKEKIEKLAGDDQHWSGLSWKGTSKTGVCLPPYFGSQSINLYPRARVLILGFKKHPTGGITAHEAHSPLNRTHHGKICRTRPIPRVTYLKKTLFIAIASFLSLPAQSQSLIDNYNTQQQQKREEKRIFSKNELLAKRCDKLYIPREFSTKLPDGNYLVTYCVNDNYVVGCALKYPTKSVQCLIEGVAGQKIIRDNRYIQFQAADGKLYGYGCFINDCTPQSTARQIIGDLMPAGEARRVSNFYTNDRGVEFTNKKLAIPTIVYWYNQLTEEV